MNNKFKEQLIERTQAILSITELDEVQKQNLVTERICYMLSIVIDDIFCEIEHEGLVDNSVLKKLEYATYMIISDVLQVREAEHEEEREFDEEELLRLKRTEFFYRCEADNNSQK